MQNNVTDTLDFCRRLTADHDPDGWPAVQTRQITELVDEIDRLRQKLSIYESGVEMYIPRVMTTATRLEWNCDCGICCVCNQGLVRVLVLKEDV